MSLKISQPRLPSAAGGPAVVVLAGEIDVATCPQLRAHLEKLVRLRQNHLLLDLTQVSFLDSSGLGALAAVYRRLAPRDGSISLTGVNQHIKRVLHITRLDQILLVHD
jgi:anti-sigma B factor antagonist